MALISAATTRGFDLFLAPFSWAGPWVGLVAISFASGAVLLLVFRYTSNQRAIRAVKDRIIAQLLEVVLYRDELSVVVRAQLGVFRDNLRYLGHALVPLACMILPVGVLLIQTDLRYGHRPLRVGEQAIVAVKLVPGSGSLDGVTISAPPGVEVETPALRMPAAWEVDWRLRTTAPGSYQLHFAAGNIQFAKQLIVGEHGSRVSTQRVGGGFRQQFLHPGEAPLPAALPVEWVRVSYPNGALRFFRWHLHWIWPWLILSMAFGYALKGPLRVQL